VDKAGIVSTPESQAYLFKHFHLDLKFIHERFFCFSEPRPLPTASSRPPPSTDVKTKGFFSR
jgi:hypothetical protein